VQHDDLHDGNVFGGDCGHRFFDCGDASVSHPFLSLLVSLRMAARALGVATGTRCRSGSGMPTSNRGRGTGARPGCASSACSPCASARPRALPWRRILLGIHPAERVEWNQYVAGWMAEYLEPGPLARVAGAPR
jgi:hypothetical protein